jgi:hypothetical protein
MEPDVAPHAARVECKDAACVAGAVAADDRASGSRRLAPVVGRACACAGRTWPGGLHRAAISAAGDRGRAQGQSSRTSRCLTDGFYTAWSLTRGGAERPSGDSHSGLRNWVILHPGWYKQASGHGVHRVHTEFHGEKIMALRAGRSPVPVCLYPVTHNDRRPGKILLRETRYALGGLRVRLITLPSPDTRHWPANPTPRSEAPRHYTSFDNAIPSLSQSFDLWDYV